MPLLDGLRVIDAASFIAGPVATTMLADLGADVVKMRAARGRPLPPPHGGTRGSREPAQLPLDRR